MYIPTSNNQQDRPVKVELELELRSFPHYEVEGVIFAKLRRWSRGLLDLNSMEFSARLPIGEMPLNSTFRSNI